MGTYHIVMDVIAATSADPFPWVNLFAFTVAAAFVTLTPGADTALVVRVAAAASGRRAMEAGLGICCGVLIWSAVVAAGSGVVIARNPALFEVLRWVGCAYLAWLGIRLLLYPRRGFGEGRGESTPSPRSAFFTGLLTNLLNPKVGAFYLSFLPQFVPVEAGASLFPLLLGAIHALQGAIWFAILVAALTPVLAFLRRPGVIAILDRTVGAVLVAFGLRLAFDRSQ